MEQAAGRTLTVSELVSELKFGDDVLPITVIQASGAKAFVSSAERTSWGIELAIGEDTENESFHDLLRRAFEALDEAGTPKSTINKVNRRRYRELADEIEEAL